MELPQTPSPAVTNPRRGGFLFMAILALGLYAVLVFCNASGVAAGSDQAGYFNHARLIAAGSLHARERELPGFPAERAPWFLYVPLGFRPAPDNVGMVPTYPPGLPLLMLAARPFAGWERSADIVLVVHAIAGLLLTWWLARALGLTRPWAVLAVAIVGASPLYLFFSVEAMSDMPSMVWVAGAVLAAWRARDNPRWAAAAGCAMGFSMLMRPTNLLALAPIALALGRPSARPWDKARRWLWLALGGLPCAAFFFLHNRAAYGEYFTTGYGDIGYDFGTRWIGTTLGHFAHWLPILFTPAVCFVLGLPWVARSAPRPVALLGVWIAGYVALYSTYKPSHEAWWYLRFLLPAAPALVIGGLLGLRLTAGRLPRGISRRTMFALALFCVVAPSLYWSRRLHVFRIPRGELVYSQAANWMKLNLPPDAVVFCSQTSAALYFYTDFTVVRWDSVKPDSREAVMAAARASARPVYAALFPFETSPAFANALPGHWSPVGDVGHISIWRLDSR